MFNCSWPTIVAKTWLDIVCWIVGLITAGVGICRGLRQAKRANEIRRAELLRDLLNQYYTDRIGNSIKAIDEKKIIYTSDEGFSAGTQQGQGTALADPALLFFANLCYLRDSGLLSRKEFQFFEWRLKKIMENECVSDYVKSLSDDYKSIAMKRLLSYCPNQ